MNEMSRDASIGPSASPPLQTLDLAGEIANADLIVVATVISFRAMSRPVSLVSLHASPTDDRLYQADLNIVRILAGEPVSHSLGVFCLQGKLPSRPWMTLTPEQTVLLFLRATADGNYVPVVPTGTAIQTLPHLAPLPGEASRTQAVAHELEQIILVVDPIAQIDLMIQATTARTSIRSPINLKLLATPILQNPTRRAAWIAIALAEGEVEVLPEVLPLFAQSVPPGIDVFQHLIAQQIRALRNPAARPYLATLLHSSRLEFVQAAIVALRQLHDPATLSDLMLALNHQNQEVRYQAVMGLAELEPTVQAGPAYQIYCKNEPAYLDCWQRWWRNRNLPKPITEEKKIDGI
jgi:hypothetical protein